jgi:hypothetical protein
MEKKVKVLAVISIVLLGCIMTAGAATISLSFDPSDWEVKDLINEASDAQFALNGSGNLQGTLVNRHPGSPWRITRKTIDTYNFQNSTLRYQWRVNGKGTYSAATTGTGSTYYFDPNPRVAGWYSTGWSFSGSEVINQNSWIYSEINFSLTGVEYTMSYSGYGGTDFLSGSYAMSSDRWNRLADDFFFISLGDNYGADAYFELSEATITTVDAPVPEPGTMLLMFAGLLGISGFSRKNRNQTQSL